MQLGPATPSGRSTTRSPRVESSERIGAPGGTRTPNRLIRSQMLYPLSYGRFGGQVSHGSPTPSTWETRDQGWFLFREEFLRKVREEV